VVKDGVCVCANAGDSRAVVGRFTRGGWIVVPLSTDQKPDLPRERARIEAAGGRVEPFRDMAGNAVGPHRVWLKHESVPGLAMARSLGDLVAEQAGVTATPEIITHYLDPADKFLVIASDGVWEFISSEECVSIVASHFFAGKLGAACEQIVNIAVYRWSKQDENVDDITVLVASFNSKDGTKEA
jgi:serine/threonine protein phosphatase PrpC